MGAGDFPAQGQAGLDEVAAPLPRRLVKLPWALLLDGWTRDVRLDDNGLYTETHPVDHKVEVAVFVEMGKLQSAPDIGGTIAKIAIGEDDAMQRDAETRLRECLADLLAAGDIAIVSIRAFAAPRWRANVELKYQNLRLPDNPTRTLVAGPQGA